MNIPAGAMDGPVHHRAHWSAQRRRTGPGSPILADNIANLPQIRALPCYKVNGPDGGTIQNGRGPLRTAAITPCRAHGCRCMRCRCTHAKKRGGTGGSRLRQGHDEPGEASRGVSPDPKQPTVISRLQGVQKARRPEEKNRRQNENESGKKQPVIDATEGGIRLEVSMLMYLCGNSRTVLILVHSSTWT